MVSKDGIIIDRREMLKVKIKSLAAEAQIIRREEFKARGQLRDELSIHRRGVVRNEARHAHIAYGLIRGRDYGAIEQTTKFPPSWEHVRRLCKRYGPSNFQEPACMS